MKVIVEGIPVSRELAAADWLTKVNKLRVARTSPECAVPNSPGHKVVPDQPPRINNGQPSGAPAMKMPTEPTPRQRGRLPAKNSVASNQPRLPSVALKLIVRPRGGLLLSKISTQLLEAVCIAAHFTRDAVRHDDLIQANLIQNTFAYCTPDIERAERVLRIKAITIDNKDYEESVYCAPDDSSGRGVIRGVDLRLDRDTIQAELQDNRDPTIADFRRRGNTTAALPVRSSRSLSPKYRPGSIFATVDTDVTYSRSTKHATAAASSFIELTFALAQLRKARAVIYQIHQRTTRANQPVACAAKNTSRAIVAAKKSTASPTRSSAGSGGSTDKPRNTES
ncbi:hypothetical protein HPB50_004020 [Hyalomma asiaticum]|uniref:Uncharacterized protein n=1 Tax=Hyalomma asiaticum TaxID=266040 RepID=A0ACB7SVF5_HYAAI|nr:hypothetical protein HPB50_004020 [Hyalomma asiaticum]